MALQDPPSNWAIHHDMLTARVGPGEPDAALCSSIAAFLPSLPHGSTGGLLAPSVLHQWEPTVMKQITYRHLP